MVHTRFVELYVGGCVAHSKRSRRVSVPGVSACQFELPESEVGVAELTGISIVSEVGILLIPAEAQPTCTFWYSRVAAARSAT